jgi:hypothetical protein
MATGMRTLLAVFGSILLATQLAACPLGCGGYSGGGDIVMKRDSGDTLILCSTAPTFVALLADGTELDGYYARVYDGTSGPSGTGVDGPTGETAFTLTATSSGLTSSGAAIGDGTWTEQSLDQAELDHADTYCQNLETQSWFHEPEPAPTDTYFTGNNPGYSSPEACIAAQTNTESCEYEIALCASGFAGARDNDLVYEGNYVLYGNLAVGTLATVVGKNTVSGTSYNFTLDLMTGAYTSDLAGVTAYSPDQAARWQTPLFDSIDCTQPAD